MDGREYLQEIRANLELGRRQNRTGEKLLQAFGYSRRRGTAVAVINKALKELRLEVDPPVNTEMPLKKPRIRFSLANAENDETHGEATAHDLDTLNSETLEVLPPEEEYEDSDVDLPEPAFSVAELTSAQTNVEWVNPDATIDVAYTKMILFKYSQLVVASSGNPRQQDIKGIVSFQSMAKAMMDSRPAKVGECIDKNFSFAESDTDLQIVIGQLRENDVVLVIGGDKRLQGIVTAWDLAEEFAVLVDPFKRIGEIEGRLRSLINKRLGKQKTADFLSTHELLRDNQIAEVVRGNLDELSMWELERVLDYDEHWTTLALSYNRREFIGALAEARGYRNRLMHFKEPLEQWEITRLTNICGMVREIPIS